ncbi:bifunctional diguanylate cyclase/phosphodiesterase [Paenibacillus sp. J5C_2022]|uniref:putative bifunctional diguanylate cyclase/phosphodiesterase n=1 Tax=Paenibacillus sp. J5C2022 TaxID=2977129 RepID=UPI0021D1B4F4|nr:bifunctional diguanylate cyclase/phosphodiesterase [Paenibacillus sp. J5C2022]MCU6712782.1 bifunctional diguanylate cyclase/phosphodiesterase [Paenibacillus sp. J5C2022]
MEEAIDMPERKAAFLELELAIDHARASGHHMLVALVDMDRFYRVNETKGTDFGNHVLEVIASRLGEAGATLAGGHFHGTSRLGGDCFQIVIAIHEQELVRAAQLLEAIKFAVERPVADGEQELYLTSSIGACVYPKDGLTSEQLLCRAELALYRSKENGGNRVQVYSSDDTVRMNRKIMIETSLRPALVQRQFHLSYQPVYQLDNGRLRGYEALIRWEHPELGNVSPEEFIPIAEFNGLIVPIGEWVLREVCKRLSDMLRYDGLDHLRISINISSKQLMDPSFVSTVVNVIDEYELKAESLELEISERQMALHETQQTAAALSGLHAAGVRIVLDDFGRGYSSYTSLKYLPIHSVKIDKSFVKDIDLRGADRFIVESMIQLARRLGLEAIAKGVEFEEQMQLLKEWGCQYVQGYLLGMPMDPTQLDSSVFRRTEEIDG